MIDVSYGTAGELSETIVGYGDGLSWSGKLVGQYLKKLQPGTSHWRGVQKVIVNLGEIEVDGLQHIGQSGSGSLGECGYAGCAHALRPDGGVLLVRRENIIECMEHFREQLSGLQCENEILVPPRGFDCR